MAETWTNITTQDDPDSGHQAVTKGRVYRDNDDCHTRHDQILQAKNIAVTTIGGQVYPTRVASGVKVRFFKPAHVKKISFKYHAAFLALGAYDIWSVVRFNNDAALETPVVRLSTGGVYPVDVVDFDISSLAEGIYEAEVYAGSTAPGGSNHYVALPGGRIVSDPTPGSISNDNTSLQVFRMRDPAWSSSPASDLTDAMLTADKGITQTQVKMLYDRDEKLRRRPAGFYFPEKTGTAVAPAAWTANLLGKIYVPLWADVLNLQVEMKVSASGQAHVYLSCVELETIYPWAHNDSMIGDSSSSTAYEFKTIRVNLAPLRGREVQLKLWSGVTVGGNTAFCRMQEHLQGAWWSVQPAEDGPINNTPLKTWPDWREWKAAGYQQGALMSAGWWRRCTNRDRDLIERQMLQRTFSFTGSSTSSYASFADAQMTIYQPAGMGAAGGKLVAFCEIASASAVSSLKLDYGDQPESENFNGVVLNVGNGIYRLERPAIAARDGSLQLFSVFAVRAGGATIYRCLEAQRGMMSWRR
jgi:hypothetical protein